MAIMEVTTAVGCPLMCDYCPQDKLIKSYKTAPQYNKESKYLLFDDFQKILNKIPHHVDIHFSGMAEPWINKDCTLMLEHALISGRKVAIYTTLYGMRDGESRSVVELITKYRFQIKTLCLHLPDADGHMKGWRPSENYTNSLYDFLKLRKKNTISDFRIMTMSGSGTFHPLLTPILGNDIKLPKWWGHSRAGSLQTNVLDSTGIHQLVAHQAPISCVYTPFYDNNVLLPNGDLLLCCMDYGRRHVIGNILDTDYYEIFQSDVMNKIRIENQKVDGANTICRNCDFAHIHDEHEGLKSENFDLYNFRVAIKYFKARAIAVLRVLRRMINP
jgi:radical SAM protein with 4Fe4S-binding SPASM domain